jgi:hypothetical protein
MNVSQAAEIIHESAKGTPCREIGEKLGIHYSTVNKFQQIVRPQIDAEMAALLTEGLTASRQTTVKFAKYGASPECVPGQSDEKWAKLSLDASKSILGVVVSSQPGTVINTLIQVNEAPQQSSELSGLSAYLKDRWSEKMEQPCDNSTGVQIAHTSPTDPQVIDISPDPDPNTQVNVMPKQGVE